MLPGTTSDESGVHGTSATTSDHADILVVGAGEDNHARGPGSAVSSDRGFVSSRSTLADAASAGDVGGGTLSDTMTANASGLGHYMGTSQGSNADVTPPPVMTAKVDAAAAASGPLSASPTPMIVERRVASAGDDVEQRTTSGGMSANVTDLELGYDGTLAHTVGLRFTGVDIPQGAIITNAYIQFRTDEPGSVATSLLIQGEDADDANPFTAAKFDVSARARTDASAAWTPDPWIKVGDAGLAQRTPDLTAIVQEIVNRSGWAALNDMAFLVTGTGTRTATSYEKLATGAPLLHIEYQMPGPAGSPVAFNVPADADATANQIAELATAGTTLGIIASASDPDAGSTVTYSIDDARFAINSSTGVITRSGTGTLDFETQTSINLTVTATSSDGSQANQTFTLGILDSPEPVAFNPQPDADAATNRIAQNAAAGTAVGITASARDPDAGSTVTYSISDNRFVIDPSTGVITRSATGTLNAQTEPTVTLNVTATSSDGSTAAHAYSLSISGAPSATPTILEKRVASSADDVEQRVSSGAMSFTSSDLELTFDGSTQQTVGMRFTGLDIPKGAVITNAYIQFTVDTVTTGASQLQIRGEDADDAAAFTSAAFNASSRPLTDALVNWAPPDWSVRGAAGAGQRTPDLTQIVQEIVSRGGWAPTNDMVFLVSGTGTRNARAYDSRPDAAPLLHVEYYVPGGGSGSPVAFHNPADANPAVNQIAELAAAGTAVGITAAASDPDAGSTVTYSIDDARFAINSSTGVITRSSTGTLDFETQPSVNLTVTATSSDGSKANQTYTLGILDSPEPVAFNPQPDADAATNRIAQNAAAGTVIGITASARDPDAGSTVTYSIDDARFAINPSTGVITRSATGTLNAQAEPTVTLNVTATSSDGSTDKHAYTASVVPTSGPQTLFRFAIFGDYGDTDLSGEKAVSALVHSWNVDFVLTVGDNVYAPQSLDAAIGQQYHDYIGNYQGAYGSGSAINRFFPSLGNHEYSEGNVPAYLNYFTLPDNERYYDFQVGPVHLFALNSNKEEPDGRSPTSVQGKWMQSVLADSDASFNLAYYHHTAFNPSGGTGTMAWPFEQWGVDAVFAGHQHNYYRENRDDNGDGVALPYITTGLGGGGRTVPNVGANLVTITDAGMLIEFYTVSSFNGSTVTSLLKDSYFIPTPAGRSPTIVDGAYVMNGTAGADYLWGLGANATLNGGRGNDMLVGGHGRNQFVFHSGDGQDTIANFVPGASIGDVLDLRAFGIDSASRFAQVATNQGANVVADLGGGDRLTLLGVQVAQFHDNDFRTDLLV
ncbi:cadherin domain-containing protein [Pseudaminobacter sp. 19-2017]|uniref:Cadherin domain-containing protein n=2 Tax=Pseudaminobacter soli (ex Zhang et al. 2022) TaxID=2831468 RepID=A0A942E0U4_9HYPH|nr:cadherin domain-containing protein [Pseudaminobacter soli]